MSDRSSSASAAGAASSGSSAASTPASSPRASRGVGGRTAALDDSYCSAFAADTSKVAVNLARVAEHLTCRICGGYLNDAQAIKECLHTFCNGCIRRHFFMNFRDPRCPTCSTKLGVKPWTQLVPDKRIQALMDKLLPSDPAADKASEAAFYASIGIKRKRGEDPPPPSARPRPPTSPPTTTGPSPDHKIRFQLLPQRSASVPLFLRVRAVSFPRVHTQALLRVMYVRKFVAKRLGMARPDELEILCRGVPVSPEHTLQFVQRTLWKDSDRQMVLEFRRAPAGVEARLQAATRRGADA